MAATSITFEQVTVGEEDLLQAVVEVSGNFALRLENAEKVELAVSSIEGGGYMKTFEKFLPPLWEHIFVGIVSTMYIRIRLWSQPSTEVVGYINCE